MPIYGSLERLNAMHQLFTTQGNGKLDRGEVEALAGFHQGLPKSSQAKIHSGLAEIYQQSKFSSGQKASLFGLLKAQGFTTAELDGKNLTKAAQLELIRSLTDDAKTVSLSSVDMVMRGKLTAGLAKVEKQIMKEQGADAEIGPATLKTVRDENKKLVGYMFEVPIYAHDHDVDQAHYFSVKGEHLGSDYIGE